MPRGMSARLAVKVICANEIAIILNNGRRSEVKGTSMQLREVQEIIDKW